MEKAPSIIGHNLLRIESISKFRFIPLKMYFYLIIQAVATRNQLPKSSAAWKPSFKIKLLCRGIVQSSRHDTHNSVRDIQQPTDIDLFRHRRWQGFKGKKKFWQKNYNNINNFYINLKNPIRIRYKSKPTELKTFKSS